MPRIPGSGGVRRERDPVLAGRGRRRIEQAGLPSQALQMWFARVLRDGFALASTGDPYQPVRVLASTHLRGPRRRQQVRRRFSGRSPSWTYPGVEPAVHRLAEAGVPALTLHDGRADTTRTLMKPAGGGAPGPRLAVGRRGPGMKPLPAAYHLAAQRCGVAPAVLGIVAAGSWNIHDAKRAGLIAGSRTRLGRQIRRRLRDTRCAGRPVEVIDGLLRLASGQSHPVAATTSRIALVMASGWSSGVKCLPPSIPRSSVPKSHARRSP